MAKANKRDIPTPRSFAPIAVGDTANRETHESGGATLRDSVTWRVVVKGLYDAVKAAAPDRGGAWDGYTGYMVDAVNLTRLPGGVGRMEIDLVPSAGWSGLASTTVLRERWEIDMAQLEKPLLTHPKLVEDDAAKHLALWLDGAEELRRANKYLDESNVKQALNGEEIIWANKLRKGVETYLIFTPVVTRIREYEGRPETEGCGTLDTPSVSVDGYEYLKTADRSVQNDKKHWTRTEQWTGSDAWDHDIYDPEA